VGQPPPVIFDEGDVARAARTASKQGRGVQQAPEPSAQPEGTAAAVARRRCLGMSRRNGGALQELSLGHGLAFLRYPADSSLASRTGKDHT
jgi:hypothetical protein